MYRDPINQTRYRTLRLALLLVSVSALAGVVAVLRLPEPRMIEWLAFLFAALFCLALIPFAHRARLRDDRLALERMAKAVIVIGVALVLQRLAWSLYGPRIDDPAASLFSPMSAFLPFVYLGSIAVMRARDALRLSWAVWTAAVLIVAPALIVHTGFKLQRPGELMLVVWMFAANPLFILMMHALPRYEEALDRSSAELAEMRVRTELMDKLTESEQRFNLVVEGLQVGVWDRWMKPTVRRWWSPRFYELIGYSPDQLEPTEENLKSLLHPDDRERIWLEANEQLKQGDIVDVNFRLNTRHRGYRWFNSHAKAERDASGEIVRLAGAINDIDDQRSAEQALRVVQADLTRLAYRDTLTDLHNRRYFDEHFQREWERSQRNGQPLSLLLIDLDHFKAYNDRYGHPAGDTCLVEIAQMLTRCANRPADIVARLGGEEFGIVLPDTGPGGAEQVAQRIQTLLRTTAIPHEGAPFRLMTLSIGLATLEGAGGPGSAEMYEQADRALYEVKRRGRDGILKFWGKADLSADAKADAA